MELPTPIILRQIPNINIGKIFIKMFNNKKPAFSAGDFG